MGQRQDTLEDISTENRDEDRNPPISTTEDDDVPACQSCRRRKLKCSREMPSCSQCTKRRWACLYLMKQKPGMKSGAVDNLNRRLETLEKLLLDIDGERKPALAFLDADESGPDWSHQAPQTSTENGTQQSAAGHVDYIAGVPSPRISSTKRKRTVETLETPDGNTGVDFDGSAVPKLPHDALLQAIIDQHFCKAHHWIPILHQGTFRAKLIDPAGQDKFGVLLHALVSASIRHVPIEEHGMTEAEMYRQIRVSRNVVMLNAMQIPSVENLQALVIVAFDLMGCGQVTRAWSIIGSLTRTVEYLQLTVEPDETPRHLLFRPLMLLPKSANWTEEEDRRRLFWNVFLLDRICSVTSGWNTSLTSDDVHRRLPSNGGNWAMEDPVVTPYFGIWDKSAGKIGNSISHIPALYPSPNHNDYVTNGSPASSVGTANVDISKLGAFAYCIESTESLSQITSFFLQQLVDFRNRQEVVSWLTRFKELDLRLVHWKMFLPQRWRDSNVSQDTSIINMDPNLTLAHITHNTSMILLHQHIAYTPADWAGVVALPSSCSVETCQSAAVETSSIAQKYLAYMSGIVNSQFVFCMFVAARILLVHWRIYGESLSPEFFVLIESLEEISRRWQGYRAHHPDQNQDLATKYSLMLKELHTRCLNGEKFGKDLLGYSEFIPNINVGGLLPPLSLPDDRISSSLQPPTGNTVQSPRDNSQILRPSLNQYASTAERSPSIIPNNYSHHGVSTPITTTSSSVLANNFVSPGGTTRPMAPSFASGPFSGLPLNNRNWVTGRNAATEPVEDELSAMSNILLGQQFMEMDRVIPFDGTDFDYQETHGW